MVDLAQKFHGLLQHPHEPLFLPKNNGTLFYDVPERFLTTRYRPIGQNLTNRFGPNSSTASQVSHDTGVEPTVVTIHDLGELPDLQFASWIERRHAFSLLSNEHRKTAGQLIDVFLKQPNADMLFEVAAYARDRLNGPLFQYALSVALLHHPDTKHGVPVPSFLYLFPDQFIDPGVVPRILEENSIVMDENRMAIDIPTNFTASDEDPQQQMAYFREDLGTNLHHWHWHLVYPGDGPHTVVNKDRRGELFYYMHHQLLNRYQADRFAQGLGWIEPMPNFREPFPMPYYPKLIRSSNNRPYPARYPNMLLSDVVRPADRLNVTIASVEKAVVRVTEAIDAGFVVARDGKQLPLDNNSGVDVLGNIIESSSLSVNPDLYGNMHNSGHILLGYIHDPRGRYLEDYSTIGDVTTAVRDPAFYMWHKFIDNLFLRHKARLAPYTKAELSNRFATVEALETQLDRATGAINSLVTFLERSQLDLGTGLDFGPSGNAFVTLTHLQHAPFLFRLHINSSATTVRRDTVRIFLLPKQDEQGRPLTFDQRRLLAIELDSFRINLRPGINKIIRRSGKSSVTIPYEGTFRNVSQTSEESLFCGCGWPAHLLLPKGNENGVEYDLFAMVSRYEDDNVSVVDDGDNGCDDASSFCGLRDRAYPSRRPMGFPFDRRVSSGVQSVDDFVTPYANMRLATVTVRFMNSVIDRPNS